MTSEQRTLFSMRPVPSCVVGSAFRLTLERVGLPAFRLCDLRHTYASLLLAAGAPITYVSSQLGHANPTTTLRYYAKWIPSQAGAGSCWTAPISARASNLEPKSGTKRARP